MMQRKYIYFQQEGVRHRVSDDGTVWRVVGGLWEYMGHTHTFASGQRSGGRELYNVMVDNEEQEEV